MMIVRVALFAIRSSSLSSILRRPASPARPIDLPTVAVLSVTSSVPFIAPESAIVSAVKVAVPDPAFMVPATFVVSVLVPVLIVIALSVVATAPVKVNALFPLFNVNPSRAVTAPRFVTLLPKSSRALPLLVVSVNVFAAIAPESVMFPPLVTVKLPVTVRGFISKAVASNTDTLANVPAEANVTVPVKLLPASLT